MLAGVGRPGLADEVHQREVLVAVGVEVAPLHVDLALGAERLHRIGLTRAIDHWLDDAACQTPVLDLEPVAQDVVDTEKRATGST